MKKVELGKNVEIIAIDDRTTKPVIGIIVGHKGVTQWFIDGSFFRGSCDEDLNLIKVTPYADFKVDDKVLVANGDINKWYRRHFKSAVDLHTVECFNDGQTQWSSKGISTTWNRCVKWEDRTVDMVLSDD